MPRKSPILRIKYNNAVLDIYDVETAISIISNIFPELVSKNAISTNWRDSSAKVEKIDKSTISTISSESTKSTINEVKFQKASEIKKVSKSTKGTEKEEKGQKSTKSTDKSDKSAKSSKKDLSEQYDWVYQYIRENGYIKADKIKSKQMREWMYKQDKLIYLSKYEAFTSNEVFDNTMWDEKGTYFECTICHKKFKYGELLPLLEHIAKEHLSQKNK